ncbi:NrtA/SsuA/CpmA family ABC transporter substrate-binding protein [Candidatus Woesearchaeota archaeon]|nr:NrtA/SsuA/CpmA family ABC transporter substrate-binding protein [Candidatus Woesearchaeota archaeon]
MKNNHKRLVGIALGIIILIGISIFFITKDTPTGHVIYDTTNTKTVQLAINTLPNSALIHIAQENGYFLEQGLDVQYKPFVTGKLALDALLGGGADIATSADVPITLAVLANQEISVVATVEYSRDNIRVIARKDSGINKPLDLEGKKISTTKGGGPMFYTDKFLEKYNIDKSKVSMVYLTPNEMVTALIKKDIDAFIVFEPAPSIAIKEIGIDKLTIFEDSDIYGETWNIVVMKDYADKNSDTIKKFLKALVIAEEFMEKNPKESLAIVAKYSGNDELTTNQVLSKQKIGVVLNDVLTTYLKEEALWAIKNKLSTAQYIPDFNEHINKEYLLEVKPKDVTI